MVHFDYFNLMEDPSAALGTVTNTLDIILCRNVLMYFPQPLAQQAVERLRCCLADGGWLVVSQCELSNPNFPGFTPVNFSQATLYRKQDHSEITAAGRARTQAWSGQINGAEQQTTVDDHLGVNGQNSYSDLLQTDKPTLAVAPSQADIGRLGTAPVTTLAQPVALKAQCRMCANEGKLNEALQLAEQAIASDKLNAGLHYLRSMILQEQGMATEAARSLRQAIYLDHDLVMAHFSMGNLALQQGERAEAYRHFAHALNSLDAFAPDDEVPESAGLLAGRLREVILEIQSGARHGAQYG